jgi:hypothetical protein
MDCHLTDTHFTLLGFFKHPNYSDWFGQLFKHEGMCIWSSDEYSFMKNARKAWPSGCTTTSTTRSDGSPIYYDLKPLENGRITVGLYTDTRCVEEYKSTGYNDPITVENVVGNVLLSNQNSRDNKNGNNNNNNNNNYASEYTLSEAQSIWDNAFDAWTVCQPCVAYDLNNVGYNANDDASKGSAYGTYTYGYDDYYYKYYYGNKGADFDCYDDAGYTNVNQVRTAKYRPVPSMCVCVYVPVSVSCLPRENRFVHLGEVSSWPLVFSTTRFHLMDNSLTLTHTQLKLDPP